MLEQGLQIMFIGMGVVFIFLFILVISMKLTAKIICFTNKIFPEPIEENKTLVSSPNQEEIIAIAIASAKRI